MKDMKQTLSRFWTWVVGLFCLSIFLRAVVFIWAELRETGELGIPFWTLTVAGLIAIYACYWNFRKLYPGKGTAQPTKPWQLRLRSALVGLLCISIFARGAFVVGRRLNETGGMDAPHGLVAFIALIALYLSCLSARNVFGKGRRIEV